MENLSIQDILNRAILSLKNNPKYWEVESCRHGEKLVNTKSYDLYFSYAIEGENNVKCPYLTIRASSFSIPTYHTQEIINIIKSFRLEKQKRREQEIIERNQKDLKYALTIL
jgi:hypothetical protein